MNIDSHPPIIYKKIPATQSEYRQLLLDYYQQSEVDKSFLMPLSQRGISIEKQLYHGNQNTMDWLVVFHNQQLIAASRVYFDTHSKTAYFSFVSVKKDYQGQGIAKNFYALCKEIAVDYNAEKIRLKTWDTNHATVTLAKKQGFVMTDSFYESIRPQGVNSLFFELLLIPTRCDEHKKNLMRELQC